MFEQEIALLSGERLRRAYIETIFPNSFSLGSGPVVAIQSNGVIQVFAEEKNRPQVEIVSIEEQLVYAMSRFHSANAEFKTVKDSSLVSCTIAGVTERGIDYFEAGMKAQLLSVFK